MPWYIIFWVYHFHLSLFFYVYFGNRKHSISIVIASVSKGMQRSIRKIIFVDYQLCFKRIIGNLIQTKDMLWIIQACVFCIDIFTKHKIHLPKYFLCGKFHITCISWWYQVSMIISWREVVKCFRCMPTFIFYLLFGKFRWKRISCH